MINLTNKEIIELDKKYILSTYKKKICFNEGSDCFIYDNNGQKYIDCIGGIATCSVGHNNPNIKNTIIKSSSNILNTSNLFYSTPQIKLAEKLIILSKLNNGKCFFCNSGTESIEAAIKIAKKNTNKNKIITLEKSFHGRTLGSLSATWNPKYKEGFGSMIEKFIHVPINNCSKLKKSFDSDVAAIIIEPIQGEGGINECDIEFIITAKKLCNKFGALLIFDEVQTGNGRTGKYFCYEHFIDNYGEIIKPDIITLAKGLANGIPIGAVIVNDLIKLNPGEHGSTFGGNNFACSVAITTINEIKKVMPDIFSKEVFFKKEILALKNEHIKHIKGKGLMLAIDINLSAKDVVEKCLENGLIINAVQENTIRLLPPLTISKELLKKTAIIIDKSINDVIGKIANENIIINND